jgi:aryl-alcohol dehydrogenase-like predicted oxidoreductase
MIDTFAFGSTGHQSSRTIFGAAALGGLKQESADRVLAQVVDTGINHIDTAASYGASEDRLKPWLAVNRHSVFLATKTGERNGDAARAELEQSLTRMGVDRVGLIQLHNLVEDEEWEKAFSPSGAVAALARAKEEGLVGGVGITGHGTRIPSMHIRSLERHPFDSVLFPWNYALSLNDSYRRDVESLMDLCRQRKVAMQTIKAIAKRRWPDDHVGKRFSWYEPLTDADAIDRAVRFVLSTPDLFLNTSSDATLLTAIVSAASSARTTVRPSDEELDHDLEAQNITALFDDELERI